MTDQDIINHYYKNGKRITKAAKLSDEMATYLKNRYADSDSVNETVYRIFNNIEIRPVCQICGGKVTLGKRGFHKYCSHSCSTKGQLKSLGVQSMFQLESVKEKSKQTCLEKYGVENYAQTDECKEKLKETCLSKYGAEHFSKTQEFSEKIKETSRQKYGCEHFLQSSDVRSKIEATNQEKFGQKNYMLTPEFKDKSKQTYMSLYGVPFVGMSKEIRQKITDTCLLKYGTKSPMQNDEVKEKAKQTCLKKYHSEEYFLTDEFKRKSGETSINRYGVDNYAKSGEFKMRQLEIQDKINNTKRQNNTFNTSSIEVELIDWFESNGIEYKHQYRSDLYPFNCDFYLVKQDLYVEIQGTWLHGGHPYNEDEDKEQLDKWVSKLPDHYYERAIDVWTVRDVKKRKIAQENGINYLEIFSCKLDECVEKISEWL
jgi:G:T-mismatch repair DNA endonuclease (very short patch repair protein)